MPLPVCAPETAASVQPAAAAPPLPPLCSAGEFEISFPARAPQLASPVLQSNLFIPPSPPPLKVPFVITTVNARQLFFSACVPSPFFSAELPEGPQSGQLDLGPPDLHLLTSFLDVQRFGPQQQSGGSFTHSPQS